MREPRPFLDKDIFCPYGLDRLRDWRASPPGRYQVKVFQQRLAIMLKYVPRITNDAAMNDQPVDGFLRERARSGLSPADLPPCPLLMDQGRQRPRRQKV